MRFRSCPRRSVTEGPPCWPNVGFGIANEGLGKMRFAAVAGAAMMTLLAASSEGMAQHKALKDCEREWLASKATNLTDGVTKQAYLDLCRVGGVLAVRAATF